jgi:glycerol-3-phosphate dehydrogenase (NAD(P)+)
VTDTPLLRRKARGGKRKGRRMKQKIAVIGAGSWGTALAISLSGKGHETAIWDLDPSLLRELDAHRENKRYLPEVPFHDAMQVHFDLRAAIYGADLILFAIPAQHFRSATRWKNC